MNRTNALLTIAISVAAIVLVMGLYQAGAWVTVVATGAGSADVARLGESLDLSIRITLIVLAVIMALQALGELWKLARGPSAPPFAA